MRGPMSDVFVKRAQAAAYLGIHVSTFERWVSRGYLVPCARTPAGVRMWSMRQLEMLLRRSDGSEQREKMKRVRAARGGG